MNKHCIEGRESLNNFKHYLKIMRITLFFLFFCILFSSASNIYSQEFTIKSKTASIKEVCKEIEKESDYVFIFSDNCEKLVDKKVNVEANSKDVTEVLDAVLFSTGLIYKILDKQIVVYKSTETAPTVAVEEPDINIIQQPAKKQITGRIVDAQGDAIIGANIIEAGTTNGSITDVDGNFTLSVDDNATIKVSYVGFLDQNISTVGKTSFEITLREDKRALDELVVVGYGVQKKVNLTGSVTSVGSDKLEKKIVSQASQLLQGETPGLTATQSSGRPGYDGADLKMRGLGTWSGAGTNPLVLVDGVPSSLNSVNPNDIDNISVLKDAASSAIYGSRAANGVILVTTKQGILGKLQVNYDTYIGKQKATELPQFVDSWTYAEMYNEAMANADLNPLYSQEDINKFRAGTDPDNFPNKSHLKDLLNSNNGLQTKHNLTFKGGTKEALYFFSVGYLKQNGLVAKNSYDRYDMMLNVKSDLRDNLVLNVKVSGNTSTEKRPAGIITAGYSPSDMMELIGNASHHPAVVPGKKSDGTYGIVMAHPVADASIDSGGFGESSGTNLTSIGSLDWNIFESLKITERFSYLLSHSRGRLFGAEHTPAPNWTFGPSWASSTHSIGRSWLNELLLEFNKTFNNHYLHFLAGFSAESNTSESLMGSRDSFPSNKLFVLSAASTVNDANAESLSSYDLLSLFGRLNYSYKDKYLLEGNVRYDGSSRFAKGNRFGLFPSFSAGWRVSEEEFFQIPWIYNLKLRGSVGVLGNQSIGNYPYQKVLSLGSVWAMGESEKIYPGIQLTNLPFADITWESTKITNGGVDISFFYGKLSVSADRYYKVTDNILYALSVSQVLGMSVGQQNAGSVENKGWEFEVNYDNSFGDLKYSITPNLSINKNKVLDLAGIERDVNRGLFINEPLQSIYGYKTDGLFVDATDIANYATQNYLAKPGFPKYVDISGPDGKPDGIISSSWDRTLIGSTFPKYNFGMGISLEYKGFDFYTLLQGQGGFIKKIGGDQLAFDNYGNIQMWQTENRWTPENPDPNAIYPRLEMAYHSAPWNDNLEYWTRDASFLRIKNLQFGYDFSSEFLKESLINKLRVYIAGENIKTFHHFYKGWDPEMQTSGGYAVNYYPITSIWSLGINVQF